MNLILKLELVDGSIKEIPVDETCAPINKEDEFIEFVKFMDCLEHRKEIEEICGLPFQCDLPKNNNTIKRVTVPFGVTSLRMFAFCRCMELEEITLPDSLEEMKPCCFRKCYNLKKVNIPPKTKRIGYECFSGCINLEDIELSKSIEILEENVFYNCQKLRNIIIPDSVKSLGYGCFNECTNLETIVIENIETIGDECFYKCENLKRVVINGPMKQIMQSTFIGCKNLESVEFPNSFETITDVMIMEVLNRITLFPNCEKLREIKYQGKTYRSEKEFMYKLRKNISMIM